jgi:hypothetical protein
MTEQHQPTGTAKRGRAKLVLVACALLFVLGGVTVFLLLRPRDTEPPRSDTEVPLGVEQAVIIRYSGPRLAPRPYRRGASVNLRIANEVEKDGLRIYDIRYVISLPGEFDLTDYLTSTDGRSIDDLPEFIVQGLTSLTKDIETRIQEIENVGVHIWHWYYESLVGLTVFWVAWLAGLIFLGRPKRLPAPPPTPLQPTIREQIDSLLRDLKQRDLTVHEQARLEALLLQQWREQLGLAERRMAASCRDIEQHSDLGAVYGKLQAWLHNPRAGVGPREFVESYVQGDTEVNGATTT